MQNDFSGEDGVQIKHQGPGGDGEFSECPKLTSIEYVGPETKKPGFEELWNSISDPCYHGSEPFYSLIFTKEDADAGVRAIRAYNQAGYRLWYNEDLPRGVKWSGEISRAEELCDVLILLYRNNGVDWYSEDFWNAYWFRRRLQKRLLLIVLDDAKWYDPHRNRLIEDVIFVNLETDNFERECNSSVFLQKHEDSSGGTETERREAVYDFGVEADTDKNKDTQVHMFNLRTHEAWDKERFFIKILSDQEADRYFRSAACRLIARSYTRDYEKTALDRQYSEEKQRAEEERKRAEEKRKREEEEKALKAERERANRDPWKDYPYMDEFEYIDRQIGGD
jgi:hypothetical protein